MSAYDEKFFAKYRSGSHRSAEQVVPHLVRLVNPRSVVDVGCGVGAWLSVFQAHGVDEVVGVDGDYVARDTLEIPPERFVAADLRERLELGREFDLAISVEVGEHLPKQSATTLVESLVRLAPVVAFSAAIPFQGGRDHLNEQWPGWWADRFAARSYQVVDCIRDLIWNDERVDWWYRQNLLLFVHKDRLAALPGLVAAAHHGPLAVVHPRNYLYRTDPRRVRFTAQVSGLSRVAFHSLRRTVQLRTRLRRRRMPGKVWED